MMPDTTRMAMVMTLPNQPSAWVSGVSRSVASCSILEMRPSSVRPPVLTTTAVAVPYVTSVPLKAMPVWSPRAASASTAEVDFSTGTDSPVRTASSMRRFLVCSRRRSAETLSPDASMTTSPGTSSDTGMVAVCPALRTVTFCGTISRSASIAWLARSSCTKPMMLLITTTAATTSPSVTLPNATARAEEPMSTQMSGLLICLQRMTRGLSPLTRSMTLGP